MIKQLVLLFKLIALIIIFSVYQSLKFLLKLATSLNPKLIQSWLQKLDQAYQRVAVFFEKEDRGSISRQLLIELSLQNLAAKKSRSLITIGGMALGIGSIVFLVSIGYGLQELVVSRVARLEELKQADIISQPNSQLKLDDQALSEFQNLAEIKTALPMISVVGRVEYKEAVADMAVYGVTTQYLQLSAVQPVQGKVFESEETSRIQEKVEAKSADQGQVAGVQTQAASFGQAIGPVQVQIEPEIWLRVRAEPSVNAKIIGYTRRPPGSLIAEAVWGSPFQGSAAGQAGTNQEGEKLGQWIEAQVELWHKTEEGYQPMSEDNVAQIQKSGYIAQLGMEVQPKAAVVQSGEVLGIATGTSEEATNSAKSNLAKSKTQDVNVTDSGTDWVEIASESAVAADQDQAQRVGLGPEARYQAVVNRAALNVLGIKEHQAVGQSFSTSFVVMGKALGQAGEKLESVLAEYEIVAVIPGEKAPLFYVPFIDLRSLGVVNYSQVKLITSEQSMLQTARKKVEAMGYVTRSVVDTVDQIKSIFATTRTVLAFLGMAALLVAALGMFNTLTVSLLERTHEVGLMKALGMKSAEVRELFMIESLTMGLLGGILGIVLGFLGGKLLSLALSVFAVGKGLGFLDVALIPFSFLIIVLFLALLVGLITGLYPAKRATKVSALNALRYE